MQIKKTDRYAVYSVSEDKTAKGEFLTKRMSAPPGLFGGEEPDIHDVIRQAEDTLVNFQGDNGPVGVRVNERTRAIHARLAVRRAFNVPQGTWVTLAYYFEEKMPVGGTRNTEVILSDPEKLFRIVAALGDSGLTFAYTVQEPEEEAHGEGEAEGEG